MLRWPLMFILLLVCLPILLISEPLLLLAGRSHDVDPEDDED